MKLASAPVAGEARGVRDLDRPGDVQARSRARRPDAVGLLERVVRAERGNDLRLPVLRLVARVGGIEGRFLVAVLGVRLLQRREGLGRRERRDGLRQELLLELLHQARAHVVDGVRADRERRFHDEARFVQTVAIQLFGFPAPARYMRMCGWVVDIAHLGLSYRAWPPDFRGMTLRRTTTVDDIVKHCLDEGLALCKKFNSTWVPENQCSALALAQGPTDERPIPPALRLVLDQNDIINLDFSEFSLLEVFGNDFTSALPAQVQGPNPVNASIPAQGLPQAQAQVQAQPQALQQPSGSLTNNP